MRTTAVLAALSVVGCSQIFGLSAPVREEADDAAIDTPTTPDASECVDTSSTCASADVLRTCTGPGVVPVDTPCPWGCGGDDPAACARLVPSGGTLLPADLDEMASLENVSLSAATTINTDTGAITGVRGDGAGVVDGIRFEARPGGGVFSFASVSISAAVTVVGSRPLLIVSRGEVTISAVLDLRGTCANSTPGPGGGRGGNSGENGVGPGAGDSDGTGGANADNGGGGGSFGSMGGGGGDKDAGSGGGGSAGAVYGAPELVVLVGGSGGAGGSDGAGGGVGGGGGGAVQIVSNDRITVSGGINAGGCGGRPANASDSGGGGGSGGGILLEAPLVTISGSVAANGGGGGGSNGGTPGSAGGLGAQPAAGGAGADGGGNGGDGATQSMLDGKNGDDGDFGGGGGGGVGRIRINTRGGTGLMSGGAAVVSPTASQGAASAK